MKKKDVVIQLKNEDQIYFWAQHLGFPSPDSDFDVRCIYIHPTEWYLGVDTKKDSLEIPISGELDIACNEVYLTLGGLN